VPRYHFVPHDFYDAFGPDGPVPDRAPWERPWTRPLRVFRDERGLVRSNVIRQAAHHLPWRYHRPSGLAEGLLVGPGGSPYEVGPTGVLPGRGALTPRGLELALNALSAYLPPAEDGHDPVECRYLNVVSLTAWSLHEGFAREVLEAMPPDGAAVPYREVARWIEARAPWLPPGLLPGER
jgi:hypothetical protein